MPPNCQKNVIDAFLATLVSLIGFNVGLPVSIEALEVLFRFIKNGKPSDFV